MNILKDLENQSDFLVDPKKYIKDHKIKIRNVVKECLENIDPKEYESIFKIINKVYQKIYDNPSTIDSYFSMDVRQVIYKRHGYGDYYNLSKKLVALDYEVKGEMEREKKKKMMERLNNQKVINKQKIYEIINAHKNSKDPLRRAFVLLLVSGSRPVELIYKSDYIPHNTNWVKQSKLAKKKEREVDIIKPLIGMGSEEFCSILKSIRYDLNNTKDHEKKYDIYTKDKTGLNSNLREALNNIAKKLFAVYLGKEETKDFTLYTGRKIYAEISYEDHGKDKITDLGRYLPYSIWVSLVLGHEYSLSSISHYTTIHLEH